MADEGRYRLAAVRDARARDERGKRGDLAVAVDDACAARERLEAARARTHTARDAVTVAVAARDALVAAGSTQPRIAAAERFITRRRHELEVRLGEELRLEATLGAREGEVDVARGHLARTRAERELIDRHFTRWRDARKKLADRRED